MKKKTSKKIISVISIAILALSVVMFSIIIIARVKGEIPGVFGYSFHLVVTDSMSPEIEPDDMVVARKTDISDIKIGDDIVFVSPDPELKEMTIVHRVVDIRQDGGLVTQGVKQGAPVDNYPVYSIKGKAVSVSSFWGKVFKGMDEHRNIVFGVALLVLVIVIVDEIIHISLEVYRKKLENKKSETNENKEEE
ncbi:MAG: signal peptidase I [Clostridia bacterium]|nr:signal peptidase I [Clostridia bacterium]